MTGTYLETGTGTGRVRGIYRETGTCSGRERHIPNDMHRRRQ